VSIPAAVIRMVEKRSGGVCEACGVRPAREKHHRQFRSRLGHDVPSNLLDLCGWGNHTGCHGVAHSKAGHELGLSVHSWDEPTEVAVQHARLGRVFLDDAGGWVAAPKQGERREAR
jgi:hypothetical protein